ncbi:MULTISPECIES: hypothetical protein [Mycobacteriaceae]|uniref:hypothetical protein n=1 Tax=Mycobacteriaceae TaxID=1762 RepID=UPI000DCF32FB|nr:hypothetical protein [Mycolicibacter senuensis]RAU95653.1 hypothetical protein DQP56_16130 [Mycolicibacter senuensis]
MTNGTDDVDFDYDYEDDEEVATPKQSNSLKWGLAAVVVLAVVALVLAAVVLLGGDPGKGSMADGGSSSRNAAAAGIASADDTGPVAIIMSDPSCTAWGSISSNLSNTLSLLGHGKWNERDQSIPASEWNDEQKKEYLAAGQVVRNAAAQTVGLVKLTPHRVMRELYEQFIAYARAFVEHIPTYTERDAALAGTAHSAASALAAICAAANNGSAATRAPLVEAQSAPTKTAPPGNPTNPQRYLTGPNPVCADWKAALDKFGADTAEWTEIDPSIPGTYWNPQQKAINLAVGPVMISLANKMQQLGRRSNNPTLQDFAELSAQYRRAFVLALPTYDPSDNYLANAATFISTTVLGACASASVPGR